MKIQVFKYMYTHKLHVLGGFVKKTSTVLIHICIFLKYIKVIKVKKYKLEDYIVQYVDKTSGTRICNQVENIKKKK